MEYLKIRLQEDIKDLMTQIAYERELKGSMTLYSDGLNNGNYIIEKTETHSNKTKNYSDYRKLTTSLIDMLDAYFKLNNGYSDEFIVEFTNDIAQELNTVRSLMIEAQTRKNNEQYRCLNSVYVLLIEELKKFEDRKPKTITKVYTKFTDDKIEGRPIGKEKKFNKTEREICDWAYNVFYKTNMEDKEITKEFDEFIEDVGKGITHTSYLPEFLVKIINGVCRDLVITNDLIENKKVRTLNKEFTISMSSLRRNKSEKLAGFIVGILEDIKDLAENIPNTIEDILEIRGQCRVLFDIDNCREEIRMKITGLDIVSEDKSKVYCNTSNIIKNTCTECDKELTLTGANYYKNRNSEGYNTTMCKACARKYILKSEGHLIDYLKKIDTPFIRNMWNSSNKDLGEYFRSLCLYNNYRHATFKDSEFI